MVKKFNKHEPVPTTDELDLRKLDRLQLLQLLRDAMAANDDLRKRLADAETELAQYQQEHEAAAAALAEGEQLRARLDEAERQLADRRIALEDSESLAEAAMRLSGTFAAAQRAIDLYGYNVNINREIAAAEGTDVEPHAPSSYASAPFGRHAASPAPSEGVDD